MSAGGTAERKQGRLQLSSLRLYIGQRSGLSVQKKIQFFSGVCMPLFVALKGLESSFGVQNRSKSFQNNI